jgi:hypothetical protein
LPAARGALCFAWEVLMIALAKPVVSAVWIMSASLACAGATPNPSTPSYFRSPALDYTDGPRSASDGQILGAQQQSTEDWLLAGPTNAHSAPGWVAEYGQLRFRRETAVGGHGTALGAPVCKPPEQGPLSPDEAQARAALRSAWLSSEATSSLPLLTSAAVEVPEARPGLLSCNEH